MVIYPESFSVKPNTEATASFRNLFNTSAQTAVNKNLTLPKGKYVFLSKNAEERELFISNTVAAEEYKEGEKPNVRKIGFAIENVKNMEIDCNDSVFIIDGNMTNIFINNCENIVLKNLTIVTVKPNVHKLTVVKASPFYVTFEIDKSSDFAEENGELFWYGTDYKMKFTEFRNNCFWFPTAKPDNYFHFNRSPSHPLHGAANIRRVSDRTFNVRYLLPKNFVEGQVFYAFPCIRDQVGIFINSSKKITLENVKQQYNPALALVAQDAEGITLENLDFSPPKDGDVEFCSRADFLQFSMCRGKIAVRNCNFDSAGDDACNVHGFHFKIVECNKDKLTVKFAHPQSYGFECIREGDVIAFIDPKTLIEVGRTKVLKAKLRDNCYYDIITATYEAPLGAGGVIENVSANPDFEFSGNTINRVVTRGVLATTRGKIRIENNKFLNTGMSGVLISDDACSWYESGCVCDAVIRGNAFMNCEGDVILIKPEVKKYNGPVHRNILIENNLFVLNDNHAVNVSCSSDVVLRGNTYAGNPKNNKWVIGDRVDNFVTDEPGKN